MGGSDQWLAGLVTGEGVDEGENMAQGEAGIAGASITLSRKARSLWAKSDYGKGEAWLPLYAHAGDAAAMGEKLWDMWLPQGVKQAVADAVGIDAALARRLAVFLCAVHDIGKATPLFQAKRTSADFSDTGLAWIPEHAGLTVRRDLASERRPSHPVAGEVILMRWLYDRGFSRSAARSLASVVGAHHGVPALIADLNEAQSGRDVQMGWAQEDAGAWASVQAELVRFACVLAGLDADDIQVLRDRVLTAPFASLLAGIVIMADWLASNECLFPLADLQESDPFARGDTLDVEALGRRAQRGWAWAGIIPSWCENAGDLPEGEGFLKRFDVPAGARPRPVQLAAIDAARTMPEPGMLIIEAPMGEGKTEAALSAAEILAQRSGRGGVCVALPTMATTDAMFGRVLSWINRLPFQDDNSESLFLAHGKAQLNETYQGLMKASAKTEDFRDVGVDLDGPDERAVVSSWMRGRKKGMLANFVVCTVDQVLMGSLQMRHVALRQLALANKVVVVDECHAYDVYMQEYLCRALEWLGAFRTPVILLSATLPAALRTRFADAYRQGKNARAVKRASREDLFLGLCPRKGSRVRDLAAGVPTADDAYASADAYPMITAVTGASVELLPVARSARGCVVGVCAVPDDVTDLVDLLADKLAEGGCAGVICDTVDRAQEAVAALRGRFGSDEVLLTHARFMDIDRMANEQRLRALLGPGATVRNGRRPGRLVVVGTQVLEQSLDIDFDLLVTDVAPIDLVLQRLGRVHRHMRGEGQADRPCILRTALCYVRGIERWEPAPVFARGVDKVYDAASLMEALGVLGIGGFEDFRYIDLPEDIAPLVQKAYGDGAVAVPEAWRSVYDKARRDRQDIRDEKRRRAQAYLLASARDLIKSGGSLDGLFSRNADADAPRRDDEDFGPRAVRDTQETVEVLLVEKSTDGWSLMPWVGLEKLGVSCGANLPTNAAPDDDTAQVLAQCAVRLPLALSQPYRIDGLIDELEEIDGPYVGAWQASAWLAGRLVLPLERVGEAWEIELAGFTVSYTRDGGLSAVRR